MRRGELAGARIDGLDLDAGTLRLARTRVVIDGQVHESDGKSDRSWHVIALDRRTLRVLGEHLTLLEVERTEMGAVYHDHGLLFCWSDGRPPHPDTFTARFNRIAEKADLPRIRLHDVRHTYATIGRRARVDAKALSQRVGHASIEFTMATYMHDDLEVDREVAATLADIVLADVPEDDVYPAN